jgi:hypothetical protein
MGTIETFEGNKMTEEGNEKTIEDISKMTTEELIKEYLKLRDETDWSSVATNEFNAKRTLLGEMTDEIKRRNYGKK